MDSRKFFVFMQKSGSSGNYQLLVLAIFCLINIVYGCIKFAYPFLFYESKYVCPDNIQQSSSNFKGECHKWVCGLPEEERSQYLSKEVELLSLANELGDFRCERSFQMSSIQTFIFLGGVTGAFFSIFYASSMTRKNFTILSLSAAILGISLTLTKYNLFTVGLGMFLSLFGLQNSMIGGFCYLTEISSEQIRGKYSVLCNSFFSVGASLNGPFYYVFENWKGVFWGCYLLPLVFCLVVVVYYLEDPPMDLITRNSPAKSLEGFRNIAKINNINSLEITEQDIAKVKQSYGVEHSTKNTNLSLLSIAKMPNLRKIILIIAIIKMLNEYLVSMPLLKIDNISESIFLNGFIIGISESVAFLAVYWFVNKVPRKKAMQYSLVLAFILSFPILFVSRTCVDACKDNNGLEILFNFISRFFICFQYGIYYVIMYEIFPTQVRAVATSIANVFGKSGPLLIPYILYLSKIFQFNVQIISTFLLVLCFYLTFQIEQTKGIPPPEVIQQQNGKSTEMKGVQLREKMLE